MAFSVQELAERIDGRIEGDPLRRVEGLAPVASAGPDDLTYVVGARYVRFLADSRAGVILVPPDLEVKPRTATLIRVPSPELAFSRLLEVFHPASLPAPGVHATAVIGRGVRLGEGTSVGPYAVIEDGATIGDGGTIGAHVYIGRGVTAGAGLRADPGCSVFEGAELGDRVRLHGGARISSDGFGYAVGPDGPVKIRQVGRCLLGDDVEVGCNSTIDRGSLGDTVVGKGTKIDNLAHIGHNCRIGRNCFVVAQVGIAGSTVVGDGTRLGGQVGIAGHLNIGAGASLGAQSGVMSNIPDGETWSGSPARPHREWLRASSAFYKLPEILRRLGALERAAEDSDGDGN
jgi:UDP-3-O-[3-hydroxymyristoyl] glucosamine N-acyltransferase